MKSAGAVYVGDVGDIVVSAPLTPIAEDVDIDALSTRELFNLLIAHGVDIHVLLGVNHCYEHVRMHYLGGRELPEGYTLVENCRYCRNCWQWFRTK